MSGEQAEWCCFPLTEPHAAPKIPKRRYFPYLILGYGVAGKAALAALVERDPLAKVLVVDARSDADQAMLPDLTTTMDNERVGRAGGGFTSAWRPRTAFSYCSGVEFARGARATALNADLGLVTLSLPALRAAPAAAPAAREGADARGESFDKETPAAAETTVDGRVAKPLAEAVVGSRKEEVIGFGRCLLALGSRPRPPPPGFIEPAARGRVALLGARDGGANREALRKEVAAGGSVTIVGSSWQALELACWLQQEGRGAATTVDNVSRMLRCGGLVRDCIAVYDAALFAWPV